MSADQASGAADCAVVVGGASGIGAACVRLLRAQGSVVAVVDVRKVAARALLDEVGGHYFYADVTQEDSIRGAAEIIERDLGPVARLINTAGIAQAPLRPHEMTMAEWDRIQAVNLRGTFLSCVAFSQPMIRRRRGAIVNIASVAGLRSVPLHSYAPSKAAVISLTQSLAGEWGPAGVRVNSVSPGYTLTPLLQDQIDRGLRKTEGALCNTPLRRLVQPEEVALAILFLASPAANAITGVDLPVDCGWLVGATWDMYGGLRD